MATITPRINKSGEITSYQIRVFRGRDSSGKRLKDYSMSWKPPKDMTKKQLERELHRVATLFEEECKKGAVSLEKYTFERYSQYVLELKVKNGLKATTAARYRELLERIIPEFGQVKLTDLRVDSLNRFYLKLAEPGQNKKTGGGLSPKTILEHHRLISSILSQAAKESLIQFNIAERATLPKVPKPQMETFEPEELHAILSALESEPLKWRVMVELLLSTGARRGEIVGLRWENVDFDGNSIFLCENRVYTPESGAISTTLKTGESRSVAISPTTAALLRKWQHEQKKHFFRLGVATPEYVLNAEDGKPMHPDSPTKWLEKFSKRHDLPPIHPHKFRHTQASLLLAQGVDILAVSKRLGHSNTTTTLNTYGHALKKADEKAAAVFEEVLNRKDEKQA